MKSFGLGKKPRSETPKRTTRPSNADLTQMLTSAQKNPEKTFNLTWPSVAYKDWNYVLSVINTTSNKDRRGWASSAIDKTGIGDVEWRLHREHNVDKVELFTMPSSDTFLIQTLIDEALQGEAAGLAEEPATAAVTETQPAAPPVKKTHPGRGPASVAQAEPAKAKLAAHLVEGNLRKNEIKTLLSNYRENKTTGRLLCDVGTTQTEVFLTNGEPVHAKSCHTFYADRDVIGDAVLIDLLTWRDGNYKFQEGWPAASKTISSTLEAFLNGEVVVATTKPEVNSAAVADLGAPTQIQPEPAAGSAPAPAVPGPAISYVEDFSHADQLIGQVYAGLVESSGYLKLGMFLMLARGEFVRYEVTQVPFCLASIGLELPSGGLSNDALRVVGECFEPVCQTLDCLGLVTNNQLFAMFPQSGAATAAVILKHFVNNVLTTPLDSTNHGSSLKITIGLCEVPRDGTDFEELLARTCQLRRLATAERKIVTLA